MILFGHPSGSPFSHQAALAHYEAGRLEAFCVPWMPTSGQLSMLGCIPRLNGYAARMARRRFEPLEAAPLVQGPFQEAGRMLRRIVQNGDTSERVAYEANDWLMRTMRRESHRPAVTAVHAYEDCSFWQFEEARRLGKACIYDLPIGYHPAWEATEQVLTRRYADWLPPGGLATSRYVRPDQKRREMELADLVLAASPFVRDTVRQFTDKTVAVAAYGVDANAWTPSGPRKSRDVLKFLFVGQISVRKGIPLLLDAWKAADLKAATLDLVGPWQLSAAKQKALPSGVSWCPPVSAEEVRRRYQTADAFVLPTFFEGRALVSLEALACGLPVLTTTASGMADVIDDECGRLIAPGDQDALIAALRSVASNRDRLSAMSTTARARALTCTWQAYRQSVSEAVASFV